MITKAGRALLSKWRFHVLDSRLDNDVAAVYQTRGDADGFVDMYNVAFPGRYKVLDTKPPKGKMTRLTPEEMKVTTSAILCVWNAIAPDIEPIRMSNLARVECCIDAGRLTEFGFTQRDKEEGVQAQALVRKLYDARGYTSTLRYLAREISLGY